MKMLPTGFPVALCKTAIQFCDRHSNRSFLLLRVDDIVVDVVDVLDVSVSEIVAFPPGEYLAFFKYFFFQKKKYICICVLCIIVSSLIFLLHKVFLSFLNLREGSSAESSNEFLSNSLHKSVKAP